MKTTFPQEFREIFFSTAHSLELKKSL